MKVSVHPGADYTRLFSQALPFLCECRYENLMVLGGICSITKRSPVTKITTLRSQNIGDMTSAISDQINNGTNRIYEEFPTLSIILLPVIGIDLVKYNALSGPSQDQETLNFTITEVNKVVTQ